MISRSKKVICRFEPPRSGVASPSSVRTRHLTFLSSRIHLRFKPFGALGGGFIGAEFADEIARSKTAQVHIVEILPKVLNLAFDDEFCDLIQQELVDAGVHLHLGRKALSINGDEQARYVTIVITITKTVRGSRER